MAKRVQTEFNVSPEALRPAAGLVDTSVVARQPAKSNSFLDLAASLQGVQPEIRGYLDKELGIYQEGQEAQAQRDFIKMSPEEQRKAVREGSLAENNSEFYVNNFNKLAGVSAARERMRDLETRVETDFDYTTGDLNSFVDEGVNADLEGVTDANYNSAYLTAIEQGRQGLMDKVQTLKAKDFQEQKYTNIIDTMWNDAEAVKGQGPKAVAESIRKWYQAGPKMFNVALGEMDGLVLQIAQRFATDGNEAVVSALVNEPRVGVDGQIIPPLANKAGTQGKIANSLIETSRTEAEKKDNQYLKEYNFKTLEKQAKLQADAAAGTLDVKSAMDIYAPFGTKAADTLQALIATNLNAQRTQADKAAKEKEKSDEILAASDMISRGMAWAIPKESTREEAFLMRGAAILGDETKSEDQRFNSVVQMSAENGMPYKPWKELLANATAAGNVGNDKEMPATFQTGFQVYQRLKSSGSALGGYVTAPQEQFYEAVAALTETGNVPLKDAWMAAREAFNNRDTYNAYQSSGRAKAINEAVTTIQSPGFFSDDWEGVTNFNAVMADAERLANTYGAVNLDKDTAVNKAVENVRKNWIKVGNVLVRKTANLPTGDSEYLTKVANYQIDKFKKANPAYKDVDIDLRPNRGTNDVWVFSDGGVPVAAGGQIVLKDMLGDYDKNKAEADMVEANMEVAKNTKKRKLEEKVLKPRGTTLEDLIPGRVKSKPIFNEK